MLAAFIGTSSLARTARLFPGAEGNQREAFSLIEYEEQHMI